MAMNAEDLLIQPFRDVVALAATAVANASASAADGTEHSVKSDQMLQAAKSLSREGDRALRKVQTIWETQVTVHGDAFRERILKQGSIESRRLRLEDLLWDFDDATLLDEFTPERYTALQTATKALALDITETIKRLHLDSPALTSPTWPLRVFPPLPPLPSHPVRRTTGTHSRKASEKTLTQLITPPIFEGGLPQKELPCMSPETIGPVQSNERYPNATVMRSPSVDSMTCPPLSRETTVASPDTVSPVSPRDTLSSSSTPSKSKESRLSLWFQSSEETLNSSDSPLLETSSDNASTLHQQPLPTPPSVSRIEPFKSPSSNDVGFAMSHISRTPSVLLNSGEQLTRVAARPADCRITDRSTYIRLGGFCSGAAKFRLDNSWSSIKEVSEFSSLGAGSGGEMLRASDGIIPLQFEETTKVGRCSECYYSHEMDEVALDKGLDLRGIRLSPSGANYRLRLLYKSHLRLSSPASPLNPPRYACLWCASLSTTPREGDATVFLSADDLLRHLTTHPQPLPSIEGISVLHGRGAHRESSTLKPFDLHLPNGPTPVPVPDNVAKLPRAIATKDHIPGAPGSGRKLPAPPGYTGEMLEFLAGAVITGVMFPEKWEGKWCLGRHDGQFGAFSVRGVEICGATEGECPAVVKETNGTGKGEGGMEEGMSVVARWKWPCSSDNGERFARRGSTKEDGWLSFAKGDLISDVRCVHADSWCWSGTNSKGKTGVFPKTHVDLKTLAVQKKSAEKEKKKGKGFFSRRLAA
ncbi:hypothetical protein B0T16DRAFT_455573 [Cercophora newfieldiana]|uniref:SH3 domain-containing protein n=1 Tax=Cercophora newfieldiana TaxID=92897 RepID=A0AA40CRK8_9PEZI|nr:hypothetical protein B0T16DRAFT_455573 [Cercophora newfieldiana]